MSKYLEVCCRFRGADGFARYLKIPRGSRNLTERSGVRHYFNVLNIFPSIIYPNKILWNGALAGLVLSHDSGYIFCYPKGLGRLR